MRTTPNIPGTLLASLATLALLAAPATAQAKPKKRIDGPRLDALLKELDGVDAKIWQQRIKLLQDQVKAHRKRATDLQRAAAQSERRATVVEQEIARMLQLQKFFQRPPGKQPAPKQPAAKRPAKKPRPKPPAKKPPLKKSPPSPGLPPVAGTASDLALITYQHQVQDLFMDNCSGCHNSDDRKGGLDLTSFAAARAGGASGTTIMPGDIERSRLYLLVTHQEKPTMPPREPMLSSDKLALIRSWIEAGAPESLADAQAFATKRRRAATDNLVANRPRFDRPAPLPKAWPSVAPAQPQRPVAVTSLASSGRSPLLAIPGMRQVLVLDSNRRSVLGILPFEHGDIEVLAFSADCSQLLVGGGIRGKRGRVALFDVGSGEQLGSYGKEYDSVLAAALHPQMSQLAMGGPKKRVRVFDIASKAMLFEVRSHNDWILGLDYSPDGKLLASGSRDGSIAVTQSRDGRNLHSIQRFRGAVQQLRFAPTGGKLAAVGDDGTLRMFELEDGKQVWQRNTGSPPKALAFSFDGKLLATGGSDGRPRLFRRNGSPLATLPSVGDWIYSLGFDQSGKQLFVGDWQGVTSVFDTATHKRIARLTPSASSRTATLSVTEKPSQQLSRR